MFGREKKVMVEVVVTQEDINHGQSRDCELCPIALVLRRHLPGRDVMVGCYQASFSGSWWGRRSVFLPREARRFIKRFDRWGHGFGEVAPFSFRFSLPEEIALDWQ